MKKKIININWDQKIVPLNWRFWYSDFIGLTSFTQLIVNMENHYPLFSKAVYLINGKKHLPSGSIENCSLLSKYLIYSFEYLFSFGVQIRLAPRVFTTIVEPFSSILSQLSRDVLIIYGLDKSEWQRALLDVIPRDQLPVQYGGTKTYHQQ